MVGMKKVFSGADAGVERERERERERSPEPEEVVCVGYEGELIKGKGDGSPVALRIL